MSRSSKGFADFFPTAPSVLQQKRSKAAQFRRRTKSPPANKHKILNESPGLSGPPNQQTEAVPLTNGLHHGGTRAELTAPVQEEIECAPGDLLNGVGSASSTSTASSIFSTNHHVANMAHPNGTRHSTSLTPLTTADSSPPANTLDSPQQRRIRERGNYEHESGRSPAHSEVQTTHPFLQQSYAEPPTQAHARPGRGEIKGIKVLYDPDLDKKLTSKERKSRRVQYRDFGKDVGLKVERSVTFCFPPSSYSRLTGDHFRTTKCRLRILG